MKTTRTGLELGRMLPFGEESLDMTSLRLRERHSGHDAPCLPDVVVYDRRFEPLAVGCRLAELTPEPTEK